MNAKFLIAICFIAFAVCGQTQSLFFENSEELVSVLTEHGFENVYITSRSDSTLFISYENRMYRDELFAAGVVLALVNDLVEQTSPIALAPCRRGLPICELECDLRLYRQIVVNDWQPEAYSGMLRVKKLSAQTPLWPRQVERSSFGKVDLTLYPTFSVHLGNYDDRFKMFLALMPVVSTSLWKGAAIYVEASVPLYNDVNYHYYRFRDYTQLSKAAFSQMARLPFDVMMSFTAGAFNPNRWGVAGEVNRLFLNRHLLVGYSVEYTGFLLFWNKQWNYSKMNLTTDKLYARYFSDFLDCQFGVSYNRYVMGDRGPLFEFSRNFYDTSVGVFFGTTELDKFGGFMLRFPFSVQKRPAPRRLRVTLPRYYEYSYRATNVVYTQHAPIQTGISIYTGTKLSYLYQNLTPNYVKNNIGKIKDAFDYITVDSERRDEDDTLFQ